MAHYTFEEFKKDKKGVPQQILTIACKDSDLKSYQRSLHEGNIIGKAINTCRSYADTPANNMTPAIFSEKAKKVADAYGLTCTVFGKERAEELAMGGFLAIERGSDQPGKFVILEYKAQEKNAPTIALVGKGVCFDSGGLHLKQSPKNEVYEV